MIYSLIITICKNNNKTLKTYFFCRANDTLYRKIKQMQQLHVDFKDYASICIKSFNKVDKESNQYLL